MNKQYSLTVLLALVAGLMGGIASTHFLMGQPVFAEKKEQPREVIIAEEFRLVDKNGKTCATLGMRRNSIPELRVLTPAYGSRTGVLISASDFESRIYLVGGSTSISMDVISFPAAIISPGLEEAEINVGFSPSIPSIEAFKSGKQLNNASIQLKVTEAGGITSGPRLTLTSKRGKPRAVLGRVELEVTATGETRERPESSLVFFDRDGKTIWSAP